MSEQYIHPFVSGKMEHDVDLGDDHWLDWSFYEEELCGGIISHASDKTESGMCSAAFTVRGSKWHQRYPRHTSWEMTGTQAEPTLSPSFLCHCGDHGFIQQGKWVRA